jgi:hypothetical protein
MLGGTDPQPDLRRFIQFSDRDRCHAINDSIDGNDSNTNLNGLFTIS